MAGVGALAACALHFFFSIIRIVCAVIQIQTIKTLVRERKRIFRDKERENDYVEVIDEDEEDVYPSLSSIFGEEVSDTDAEMSTVMHQSAVQRPPKEDDVIRLKSRRHISRLTAMMRNTHIERWINASHDFVEDTNHPEDQVSKVHIFQNLPVRKRTELTRQQEITKLQDAMNAPDDDYVESIMSASVLQTDKGISVKSDVADIDVVETLKLLQMHHDKNKKDT